MYQESPQTSPQHGAAHASPMRGEMTSSQRATEWRVSKEQLAAAERANLYHARKQAPMATAPAQSDGHAA